MKRIALAFVALLFFAMPATATSPLPPANVRIEQPWARPAAKGADAAVYLSLTNTGKTPLTLTQINALPVSSMSMVHETTVSNGVAKMRMVEDLVIAPGETIDFTPKDKHIMLTGLTRDLKLGERFSLGLQFGNYVNNVAVPVQAGRRILTKSHV